MPKETISSDFSGDISVRVGWERDKYVQVASVNAQPFTVRWHHDAAASADPDTPDEMECDGMYASLDREGLNRLIRVLRRARDAAYGRDE